MLVIDLAYSGLNLNVKRILGSLQAVPYGCWNEHYVRILHLKYPERGSH